MSYGNDEYQNKGEDSRECEAMRKMFVGALNRSTSSDVFSTHFSQYGDIVDKVIITDPHTKESRGFGFITYAQSESVEKAFKARPHNLDGKQLDVKRAMPREYNTAGAHSKTKKLFVGGFKGSDLTPEELRAYIESRHPTSVGRIEKIDFFKERETQLNKGFGFLDCSDTDFADRLAISETSFRLKGKNMSIKKAEPKPEAGAPAPQRGGRGGGRGARGGRGGYDSGMGGNRGEQTYNNTSYPSSYGENQGGYNNYGSGYGEAPQQSRGGGAAGGVGGGYQTSGGYNQGGESYGQSAGGGYSQGGYDSSSQGYGQQGGYGQSRGGYNQRGNYNSSPARGGRGGASRGDRGGGQRYQPY